MPRAAGGAAAAGAELGRSWSWIQPCLDSAVSAFVRAALAEHSLRKFYKS